jgi:SAM-dependent methyltransferase
MLNLQEQFGQIDIYLFDQILRGRIGPGMRILDAGCGGGRNLIYLLRQGYEVFGLDRDSEAIAEVRRLAADLAPTLPATNFELGTVEAMPYADAYFDFIISSAVLHFARDDQHFRAMINNSWRILKPAGLLFCRLASSIGVEKQIKHLAGRHFLLPDGSERYLVDEALLANLGKELEAQQIDPIRTTVVQSQRAMTTWIVRKTA